MPKRRSFYFNGLGVSGGVVIGPAYVIEPQGLKIESHEITEQEIAAEIERFHRAVAAAKKEIHEVGRQVAEIVDPQQASIFDAHITLLSDPLLIDQTDRNIRENRRNAEFVFWSVTKEIGEQLESIGDTYFSERSHDLFDIGRRVLKFLDEERHPAGSAIPQGCIVVANDLGPSDTALMHRDNIAGFATDAGGPTSHTAIMAKALSLPAVVALDFLTHYARTGDRIIVDGTEGKVVLNPSADEIAYYENRAREFESSRERLTSMRSLPAITLDGELIRLEANIEFVTEVSAVVQQGAEGIGLYRTEYFFIERRSLPSEEEQEKAYARVIEQMEGRHVVFRTLDVGGDKLTSNIPTPNEGNPFLGLRAIRLCLAYPDLFRCQLRPLMRAARGGELHLLLPMISGIEEVRQAKAIINEVREDLIGKGIAVPSRIHIGIMIEIPSAAIQAELLAAEADFFSIGTNDLVQYTLAVDRVNKMVGHLYHETHPAVLRLISDVVKVAEKTNTPLTVCGEMAGDPMLSLLLIGLGVRTLSMSPSLINVVRKAIRGSELSTLKELATHLLSLSTPAEVRETLVTRLIEQVTTDSAAS